MSVCCYGVGPEVLRDLTFRIEPTIEKYCDGPLRPVANMKLRPQVHKLVHAGSKIARVAGDGSGIDGPHRRSDNYRKRVAIIRNEISNRLQYTRLIGSTRAAAR